jgi:hypothetical protein
MPTAKNTHVETTRMDHLKHDFAAIGLLRANSATRDYLPTAPGRLHQTDFQVHNGSV